MAAGNERHKVVKLGRIRTAVKLPNGNLGYIDTGKKLGWYVPSISFPLFSVGILKGLGWGFSIGMSEEDYMFHKTTNTRIPLNEVAGISTIMTTNPDKEKLRSVAAYINSDRFGGGDSKSDPVDMDIASDLLWNTLIDLSLIHI